MSSMWWKIETRTVPDVDDFPRATDVARRHMQSRSVYVRHCRRMEKTRKRALERRKTEIEVMQLAHTMAMVQEAMDHAQDKSERPGLFSWWRHPA